MEVSFLLRYLLQFFFFFVFFNVASVMLPLIVATMCGSEVLRPWIPAADNLSSLSLLH